MPLPPSGITVPGQPLGPTTSYLPGSGVYVRYDNQFTATIVGRILIDESTTPPTLSIVTTPPLPPLTNSEAPSSSDEDAVVMGAGADTGVGIGPSASAAATLPEVGSIILGRVTRTNPRQCSVEIFAFSPPSSLPSSSSTIPHPANFITPPTPFHSTLRLHDIRATEKDRVKIATSYKLGDIIRAVVIGLGDQMGGYLLSTGANGLGVVVAWSEDAWEVLVPKSWREMVGVKTGRGEERKVARPV